MILILDDTVKVVETPSGVKLEEEFEIFASIVFDSSGKRRVTEGEVQLDGGKAIQVPVFVPQVLLGVPHVDTFVGDASEHLKGVREPRSVEDLEVDGKFEHRGKCEAGCDVGAAHDTHVHVVRAEIALHFVAAQLLGALVDDGVGTGGRARHVAHGDEALTVIVRWNDQTTVDVTVELSADCESGVVISADRADCSPRSLGAHLDFSAAVALGVVALAASVVALAEFQSGSELILPAVLIGGFDQTVGTSVVLADLVDAPIVPELLRLEQPHLELDGLVASGVHPVTTRPGNIGASELVVVELLAGRLSVGW